MEYQWVNESESVKEMFKEDNETDVFWQNLRKFSDVVYDCFYVAKPGAVYVYNSRRAKEFSFAYDLLDEINRGRYKLSYEICDMFPEDGIISVVAEEINFDRTDINVFNFVRKLADYISIDALTDGTIRFVYEFDGLTVKKEGGKGNE